MTLALGALTKQHDAVTASIQNFAETIDSKRDRLKALEKQIEVTQAELAAKEETLAATKLKVEVRGLSADVYARLLWCYLPGQCMYASVAASDGDDFRGTGLVARVAKSPPHGGSGS